MNAALVWIALTGAAFAEPIPRPPQTPLDRSKPVPPASPLRLPHVEEASLENGLKIALLEMRRLPLVCVRVIFPFAGSSFDPQGKAGLADLLALMLTDGTLRADGRRFAEAVENLGARLEISAEADALVATVFAMRSNIDPAMRLLASALRGPSLKADSLKRNRRSLISGLKETKGDPGALAEDRLLRRVHEGSLYGHRRTEASLSAVSLKDIRAFHESQVRPDGAIVAASGDIDLEKLQALVFEHFGHWSAKASVPRKDPAAPSPGAQARGMTIEIFDFPGALQSSVRVGRPALHRSHPDYAAAELMNFILGDENNFLSRLNQNLRERRGWTYGALSELRSFKNGGRLIVSADVQTDATAAALREILRELSLLREEAIGAEELEAMKRSMCGAFLINQQTVQQTAEEVGDIELHGLPADTLATARERIMAVTAADVQRAAKAYLSAESLRVVIAGDASKIQGDLSLIAPVRVLDADSKPKGPAG